MVGEGVVFQGMRGYTVPPHAPVVACLTMSLTQHIWLKKKYRRVPTFNPVGSEATRLSYFTYFGSPRRVYEPWTSINILGRFRVRKTSNNSLLEP